MRILRLVNSAEKCVLRKKYKYTFKGLKSGLNLSFFTHIMMHFNNPGLIHQVMIQQLAKESALPMFQLKIAYFDNYLQILNTDLT